MSIHEKIQIAFIITGMELACGVGNKLIIVCRDLATV